MKKQHTRTHTHPSYIEMLNRFTCDYKYYDAIVVALRQQDEEGNKACLCASKASRYQCKKIL